VDCCYPVKCISGHYGELLARDGVLAECATRGKFAARMPWIACVVRLSSYECGMDQPTYSPVQRIVECSGTLSFQDLDSTRPAGSVKIRVETIAHYSKKCAPDIIARKRAVSRPGCPL
jgi:predicted nucleotide-binding protein (sugar kinase/HSP70/actin superfamily)